MRFYLNYGMWMNRVLLHMYKTSFTYKHQLYFCFYIAEVETTQLMSVFITLKEHVTLGLFLFFRGQNVQNVTRLVFPKAPKYESKQLVIEIPLCVLYRVDGVAGECGLCAHGAERHSSSSTMWLLGHCEAPLIIEPHLLR